MLTVTDKRCSLHFILTKKFRCMRLPAKLPKIERKNTILFKG